MSLGELNLSGHPHLRVLLHTTSTNDDARAWARAGAPDGATVVADQQTAGRGRVGRGWISPPGLNLYLSQIIRARTNRLGLAPLLGALAARDAVEQQLPQSDVRIKWPNDVLADGRKVAGVLAEFVDQPMPAGILGIGVNVNMTADDFPQGLRTPAASLRMICGGEVQRRAVLQTLLERLDHWRSHLHQAPGRLVEAFVPRCLTLGRRVRITPPGDTPFQAVARSVDANGRLVVENQAGRTVRIEAGDVDLVDREEIE